MQKKKSKAIGVLLFGLVIPGVIIGTANVGSGSYLLGFGAGDHVHYGYHYVGNGVTEAYKYEGIQREFWTCCGCPDEGIWLTKPSTGTFVDRPIAQCEGGVPEAAIQKAPWTNAQPKLTVGSQVTANSNVYTMPASGSVETENQNRSLSFLDISADMLRRYFSFDVTISNGGWGGQSDLYITVCGHKNGEFVTGVSARLAYGGAAFHRQTEFVESYNPLTGVTFGDGAVVVPNRRTEYVVDLSSLDDVTKIAIYTDAGSTITVNSFSFKDTLCGHSADDYCNKSSIADGEYCASRTWKECSKCAAQTDFVQTVPAAKETISLNNYSSKNADLSISGNVIYSTGAQGNTRLVSYNIPERFVGKGKLVVKLVLSSAMNAFDVRLKTKGDASVVQDFGQVATGGALNKGLSGVTVVTDTGDTTNTGSNFLKHVITYTFDLSVLSTAQVLQFGLWWGTQVLQINELYFEEICSHSSGNVVHVQKPASEYEDGCERDLCGDCGQIISTTSHVDSNKRLLNLPETLPLSSTEYMLLNIFDHASTRTKIVIKFTLEQKDAEQQWNYLAGNYSTYMYFYKNTAVGGQVPTGAYEETKTDETTFMQLNSSSFGDARRLANEPNVGSGNGTYGILPTFVAKDWDSEAHVVTMTFDLTDSRGANLYGISFKNGTADTRIHIFEAYQYIPA